MRVIDTRMILGLALWILGFALMTAGWLVDELFEDWGRLPARVLRKTGALIVAMPVIVLLWRAASFLYANRVDIALLLNDFLRLVDETLKVL